MLNDTLQTLLDFLSNWTVYGMSLSEMLNTISGLFSYFGDFLDIISPVSYFIPWAHIKIILSLAISTITIRSFIAIWKLLPLT